MSPVYNYKKIEKEVVDVVEKKFKSLHNIIISFFKSVHHAGKQRFTVMFIPHSEKKIFNFQISIYSLTFFIFLIGVIIVSLFFLATQVTSMAKEFDDMDFDIKNTGSSLEYFREEVSDFNRSSREFLDTLKNMLKLISPSSTLAFENSNSGGTIPEEISQGKVQEKGLYELYDLAKFKLQLENAKQPLLTLMNLYETQKDLFIDIPTIWPLQTKGGYITAGYGPRIHPIYGVWHIHRGIDIAYPSKGIKIVSTAAGKVIKVDFEPLGYGNYVVVSHKYGFYTLYAHLSEVFVKRGAELEKGQAIGYLGATGVTTGPHLHYEVILGAQNIDPMQFLKIESSLFKKTKRHDR